MDCMQHQVICAVFVIGELSLQGVKVPTKVSNTLQVKPHTRIPQARIPGQTFWSTPRSTKAGGREGGWGNPAPCAPNLKP